MVAALIALLLVLEAGVGALVWLMAHPPSWAQHLAPPTRGGMDLDVEFADPHLDYPHT